MTRKTREERDLAVGGDAAARDAPHDGVDEGVRGGRVRQGCVRAMPNVWRQRRAKRVRCTPGLGSAGYTRVESARCDATRLEGLGVGPRSCASVAIPEFCRPRT